MLGTHGARLMLLVCASITMLGACRDRSPGITGPNLMICPDDPGSPNGVQAAPPSCRD